MSIKVVTGRVGVALLAGALALAQPAPAQGTGDGFLFRRPRATFAIRAGYDRALAGSDVFSFATERLTLGRGSFSSLTVATDLSARLNDRVDLVFGASYSGSRSRSEFRDWVDQDSLPIEQTTSFDRLPLTVGLKIYLAQRGRSLGHLAWVPARYVPYVGVGAGAMWYRFRQEGDFVDFETLDVFGDKFDSSGWTMTAHGLAGVEVALGPRFFLVGEGRYTWAQSTMGQAWVDFDRIDLSGFSVTAGIAFRM
jgi:hypothetical protein